MSWLMGRSDLNKMFPTNVRMVASEVHYALSFDFCFSLILWLEQFVNFIILFAQTPSPI